MTERPLSISTQLATPIQTAFNSSASIPATDAHPVAESVDEEPYTIKCICDYSDDDGNTIYCETCDTWQHIECFYPGRVADASRKEFDHSCADCKPRPLDKRHATERQRSQRQNKAPSDNSEKKTKRPPSKSHKKKSKPSDLQVNGYHDHDGHRNGSPQDHHSLTKKPKGHRSSQSVGSQIKRSPPYNSRPNSHTHPPSPAHTPPDLPKDFELHRYSLNFLHLFDGDQAVPRTNTNSFASLEVTNSLALWLHNPEKLLADTGVTDEKDAYQRLKHWPDTSLWPTLHVDQKETTNNDLTLRWRSLVTRTSVKEAYVVGELVGLVGFQKDYCTDPEAQWNDFIHPKPFVFFPPHLPLCIDTRREGSLCRYARRSCRPTTNLETFIANGSEYHFWMVSERPLAAGEQITLPWDFRFTKECKSRFLHLLNLDDPEGAPFDTSDITDEEYEQLTNLTQLVLSDYGGCACDLGKDCAFARFHRNYHGKPHAQPNGVKPKKGRKPKQSHVSPTSTDHATNSRAASEGQQDQYDEDDSRSVSGSVRSKPQSRDLTPLLGVSESNGILTETTDREKRKIAMFEDSFRKMEQGQPARKKKRTSEGSTMNVPTSSTTPQPTPKPRQKSVATRIATSQSANASGSRTHKYVDASTSRPQSGSPFSAISQAGAISPPGNPVSRGGSAPYRSRRPSAAPAPKSSYTDSSTQTDDVENTWYSHPCATPSHKRPIVPLSKRLLQNRHKLQKRVEARRSMSGVDDHSVLTSPTVSMDLDPTMHEEPSNPASPVEPRGRNESIASSTPSVDASVVIIDLTTDAPPILVGNTIKPPPPPWPGHSNLGARSNSIHRQRSPDLRVQMPPTPSFSIPIMSGTFSGNVTPSSAAGSVAQSPLGTVVSPNIPAPTVNGIGQHPSPVRAPKKLSLSDYKAARAKKDMSAANKPSAGSSPTVAPAVLKPSLSAIEELKAAEISEGSVIVDTPMAEKAADPMTSDTGPTSAPASKDNMPSDLPNGTL